MNDERWPRRARKAALRMKAAVAANTGSKNGEAEVHDAAAHARRVMLGSGRYTPPARKRS